MQKKAIALKSLTDANRRGLNKYKQRGFTVWRLVPPEHESLFCLDRIRWVGDADAWCIELPTPSLLPIYAHYISPARTTTWSIGTFLEDRHCIHFYQWMNRPSVFPVVVASVGVYELVTYLSQLYDWATHGNTERTVNGGDE